jgi:hypothetical protein
LLVAQLYARTKDDFVHGEEDSHHEDATEKE